MLKTREIVLLIILLVILAAGGYYLLYYQPTSQKIMDADVDISNKQGEVDDARVREALYVGAMASYQEAEAQYALTLLAWEASSSALSDYFDDTTALRHIQDYLYARTDVLEARLLGVTIADEETSTTAKVTITLNFITKYDSLLEILEDFAKDRLHNRIVNYTLGRMDIQVLDEDGEPMFTVPPRGSGLEPEPIMEEYQNVTLNIEFLIRYTPPEPEAAE
jgi:hypothetical protein